MTQNSLTTKGGVWVIKDEPFTHIEIIENNDSALVRKKYITKPGLWWRTVIFPSKAFREFRNLSLLKKKGVPCVDAVSWSEERGFLSRVCSCTVETRFVKGCVNLKKFFREVSPETKEGRKKRIAYCMAFGRILKKLHEAGIFHGAASTRNFLAHGDSKNPNVIICDVPYSISFRRSIRGKFIGELDLYDALFAPSRKKEFSCTERFRILKIYTDNDSKLIQKIWKRLDKRKRWKNKMIKGMFFVLENYLLFIVRVILGRRELTLKSKAGGVSGSKRSG